MKAFAAMGDDQTADPDKALRNLLECDRMFTERLGKDTKQLGLRTVTAEMSIREDAVAKQIIDWFGLSAKDDGRCNFLIVWSICSAI